MTLRLICSDGEAVVPRPFLQQMSLFQNHPELAKSGSYTLTCKPHTALVNRFLSRVYGSHDESDLIPEESMDELRSLCKELGYTGFDEEFRQATSGNIAKVLDDLEQRVNEHDTQMVDFETAICEVNESLSLQTFKIEFLEDLVGRLQSQVAKIEELEKKVEAFESKEKSPSPSPQAVSQERQMDILTQYMDKRLEQVSARADRALAAVTKREELEQLAQDVARLKTQQTSTRSESNFVCSETKPLDGIIAHLTRKYLGNVHDKGVVEAIGCYTISEEDTSTPRNLLDLVSYSFHESPNTAGAWVAYDFKWRRVNPTSYSLRTTGQLRGGPHPKSWVLEVSNDGFGWTEVDRRTNVNELNSDFVTRNFKVSSVVKDSFRYIRLRLIGPNHAGTNILLCSALEIFGTLSMGNEQAEPGRMEFACDMAPKPCPPLFPLGLDGIIAHLTRKYYGLVSKTGVVDAKASSIERSDTGASNTFDYFTTSVFASLSEHNAWIMYDFKDHRIIPKSYTIRSGRTGGHPRSWIVQVSNGLSGESDWTTVDRREKVNALNGARLVQNFVMANVPNTPVRFIRIVNTGRNHGGDHYLFFAAFEVYGTLVNP